MTPEVFTAGGATLDCTVAADGTLALGVIGGNAIHSAAGARLLCARVGVVARVPQGWPLAVLAASGIDVGGVRIEPVPEPAPEWFFHRADGSRQDRLHAGLAEAARFGLNGRRARPEDARAFAAHLHATRSGRHGYAAFRAAHPVCPEHVPSDYWQARIVHIAPAEPEAQLALVRAARARGLCITLDPGFGAAALTAPLLAELLATCDVFLPSEAELQMLRPGLAPEAAVASLTTRTGPVVLAKLGARGALLLDPRAGEVQALAPAPAHARDPTGAGDAFAGGLAAGLALGEPMGHAARRALLAGACAVEQSGALALLGHPASEVAARLSALQPSAVRSLP